MIDISELIKRVDEKLYDAKYLGRPVDAVELLEGLSKDLNELEDNPDWDNCPNCSDKDDIIFELQKERDELEDEVNDLKDKSMPTLELVKCQDQ